MPYGRLIDFSISTLRRGPPQAPARSPSPLEIRPRWINITKAPNGMNAPFSTPYPRYNHIPRDPLDHIIYSSPVTVVFSPRQSQNSFHWSQPGSINKYLYGNGNIENIFFSPGMRHKGWKTNRPKSDIITSISPNHPTTKLKMNFPKSSHRHILPQNH